MFQTNIKCMETATGELQKQIRQMAIQIEHAEDAVNVLKSLSGMEEAIRTAQNIISNMETERRQQVHMRDCLEESAQCYRLCENNIVEYAEEAAANTMMGLNSSDGWQDLQERMIFIY